MVYYALFLAFRIFDKFHKSKSSGEVMDVSDFSVYYDVKTNEVNYLLLHLDNNIHIENRIKVLRN